MKKVLILAYDFPPYVSVGGLRPYSWYKYFHEFGLYPVVVTRQWGNEYGNHLDYIAPGESDKTIIEESETGTIIRTAYKPNLSNRLLLKYGKKRFRLLRKAITAYYEFMQFLFFVGPKAGLYRGAKQYLKQQQVDAIIATGSPHILFKYAAKLSQKHNIPWIADYRDPWSHSTTRSRNRFLLLWNRYFEKRFIKNTTIISTATDFVKEKVSELFPAKNVSVILNGFDPEIRNNLKNEKPKTGILSFAFAGTVYPWHNFYKVIKTIVVWANKNEYDNIEIALYGLNIKSEKTRILLSKLMENNKQIRLYKKIDYARLLESLSKSHILLLFNDYEFAGTKVYDYLAINRKILFCFTEEKADGFTMHPYFKHRNTEPNAVQVAILNKSRTGVLAKGEKDLINQLNKLYEEFIETKTIACQAQDTDQYSRKVQAEKLAMLIIENV